MLREALRGAPRVHLIGLVSDGGRALEHGPPPRADPPRGRPRACRTSSSTPSPTGATPRRPAARPTWRRSRLVHRRRATPVSGASSAATSRWTATSAGSACSRPTTCSSTGAPSTASRTRRAAARDAYDRGETDEFITATTVGDQAAIRPGRQRHRLQLPSRPDARDHARARRAGLHRCRPRRRRARRALHVPDRVRGGLAATRSPSRPSARASRCRTSSRPRAGASCTSPRPRSTRT